MHNTVVLVANLCHMTENVWTKYERARGTNKCANTKVLPGHLVQPHGKLFATDVTTELLQIQYCALL